MQPDIIRKLDTLNKVFYETVASSFSESRQQPWNGWQTVWTETSPFLPKKINVFDIGCGNGRFAEFLCEKISAKADGGSFEYTGIDQNEDLLAEAKKRFPDQISACTCEQLAQRNIIENLLSRDLLLDWDEEFDLAVSFGVLHHIPSKELRIKFLQKAAELLVPGGILVISCWQFDRNLKLMERKVKPSSVDLEAKELEKNDFLLTWERGENATRYCHLVDREEQDELIKESGLKLLKRFAADGKSGEDNEYVILQR